MKLFMLVRIFTRLLLLGGLVGGLVFVVLACSSNKNKQEQEYVKKIWRINPSSTVMDKPTQFYLTGKRLDTLKISAGKTVHIERGEVTGKGTKQHITIKVAAFKEDPDSDYEDEPGKREIRIHTPKKVEKIFIKILDEDPKSEIDDVDHQ